MSDGTEKDSAIRWNQPPPWLEPICQEWRARFLHLCNVGLPLSRPGSVWRAAFLEDGSLLYCIGRCAKLSYREVTVVVPLPPPSMTHPHLIKHSGSLKNQEGHFSFDQDQNHMILVKHEIKRADLYGFPFNCYGRSAISEDRWCLGQLFPKHIDSSQRVLLTQAWPAQNVAFLPFRKPLNVNVWCVSKL